jgi:ABC-type spermidine/putrescine transport system permease subunit II
MDLWTMLGVSRQVALGGMAAGLVAVVVAARVLARRSAGRGRNVVRLTDHD